jgi:ABC-2 type transport system ATP-binding protein
MTDPVVVFDAVDANYGVHHALHKLSFTLERGRTLSVVGPNGAGKSTLFRVLTGLHAPASGNCKLLGERSQALPPQLMSRIAFVPETHAEEPGLSVASLVDYRAALYPRFDRSFFHELAANFALRKTAHVRELSRGQRAGLVVGLALAQKPEVLLLDDPLLGLDPLAKRRIIEAILERTADAQMSTLLAAHELGDIERVTDDVVLLGRGKSIVMGALHDVLESARLVRCPKTADISALEALPAVLAVDVKRDAIEVVVTSAPTAVTQVAFEALGADVAAATVMSFEQLVLAWLSHENRKEIQR